MEIFAVASIVILMILGYFLMDRVGELFVKNTESTAELIVDKRSTLIFTDSDSEEKLCKVFENLKFSYYLIDNAVVPENLEFATFFALSSDDGENLFFIRLVKKKQQNVWIIAKVNDYVYADLYRKVGVNKVITGAITPERIIESLQGVSAYE